MMEVKWVQKYVLHDGPQPIETGNMKQKAISAAEIVHLRRTNHVAYVYPRRGECVVDGFKRYTITQFELAALRQANNGLCN